MWPHFTEVSKASHPCRVGSLRATWVGLTRTKVGVLSAVLRVEELFHSNSMPFHGIPRLEDSFFFLPSGIDSQRANGKMVRFRS